MIVQKLKGILQETKEILQARQAAGLRLRVWGLNWMHWNLGILFCSKHYHQHKWEHFWTNGDEFVQKSRLKPCYNVLSSKKREHWFVFISILLVLYIHCYHSSVSYIFDHVSVVPDGCKFHCRHSSTHWNAITFIARSRALITASITIIITSDNLIIMNRIIRISVEGAAR